MRIALALAEAVRRFGADPDRVAIGGISMGGYGAFEIARSRAFLRFYPREPARC
jgi:S-formylglutathione hydrolase FrmB